MDKRPHLHQAARTIPKETREVRRKQKHLNNQKHGSRRQQCTRVRPAKVGEGDDVVDAGRQQHQEHSQADKGVGGRLARHGRELEAKREELSQREAVLTEQGFALEHALELAKSQLRDQAVQLEKTVRDLEQARSSLATLVQERDADRHQFDKHLSTLSQERERLEQRAAANEHRLLEEVDRARHEVKQTYRVIEDLRQKHAIEKQELERTNAAIGNRVHEGQIQLAALKARLQGVEERAKGLESALAAATLESRRSTKGHPSKPARHRPIAEGKRSK